LQTLVNEEKIIMAFQNLDTGSLDVFSAVAGSSLNIPKGFWKPGTAAIYNGYLGTTALSQYGQGTCNVGMSPDSPLLIFIINV
jgi:hypothetical protein